MAERPTFGRRGVKTETPGDDTKPPRRPRKSSSPDDDLLLSGGAAVAAARKKTIGWSLTAAGALAAAGLWFAETAAEPCRDDPATPMVDEAKVGDCADRARSHRSGGWTHWVWRSGSSGWRSSNAPSSSFVGGSSSAAPSSSASRGGFGSLGSFHGFGGG